MRAELDLEQEPLLQGKRELLPIGSVAPDFKATLMSSQEISLEELLRRGPVVLNFIKGTWCPFCQKHLYQLRSWQQSITLKSSTILVLSSEGVGSLRAWLTENPMPYLFAAPKDSRSVFQSYGVDVERETFARPATFLIDAHKKVLMSYGGARGSALAESCENCGITGNTPRTD
jgi:peroxiredoxin